MADLQSPGVSVTVTDDTISAASSNGTVPLFFIATAQDKLIPNSATVASGTTAAKAGKLQLVTSQKNVLETFGSPIFQKSSGSVIQGDELNEYGLHALYSYMGLANRAYVLRADIDLAQLQPTGVEPTGPVTNGTLWLDTTASQVEAYVAKVANPTSFYDWQLTPVTIVSSEQLSGINTSGFNLNDLVIRNVPSTGQMLVYMYTANGLAQQDTVLSPINKVPTAGKVWIRSGFTQSGTQFFGTRFVVKRYRSLTNVWASVPAYTGNSYQEVEAQSGKFDNSYIAVIFDEDSNSFSTFINSEANPTVSAAATTLTGTASAVGSLTFKYLNKSIKVQVLNVGDDISGTTIVSKLGLSSDLVNDGFSFVGGATLTITNKKGYSFVVQQSGQASFSSTELNQLATDGVQNYAMLSASNFSVNANEPKSVASEGTLWFNFSNENSVTVTLYTADVSTDTWTVVQDSNKYVQLDEPNADRLFWVKPLSQGGDGYVFYKNINGSWTELDTTDQSTLNGVLFEDFGAGVPAADLYQNGMLAVDMGATEGVVLKMVGGKWQVVSGTALDGSGLFGRAAQRQIIVESLASAVVSNEDIRSETIEYNLISAPGYVELLDELVTLNTDRKETAFIVTDVPARLSPTAMAIQQWATNANNAPSNGEIGRTTAYAYAAQYGGWCLSTNVDGEEVAVPGSTIAMRTFAYSDSVSYVWFPPAGTQRGVVSNAASVGYINGEGEYAPVVYNQGQRDTMYTNNINPIAMRPNRGLLVFGDKTLSPNATSALSRVNVARLIVYIRKQLELLAEPFLFRLNTASTRQAFTAVVNSFLSEILQLEGLQDFLVVCDESNNTTERVNRNELWMDVALVPTRSINFIYIPIRIETDSSKLSQ